MRRSDRFRSVIGQAASSSRIDIGNLVGAAAALFGVAWFRETSSRSLIVLATPGDARLFVDDAAQFAPDLSFHYLPTRDEGDLIASAERSGFGRRLEIARDLAQGKSHRIVVTSVAAAVEALPAIDSNDASGVTVAVGEEIDRDDLVEKLVGVGFERMPLVEDRGQVSCRGGIVDVQDATARHPVRIELFGDTVESIRTFDLESQLSLKSLERCEIALTLPEDDDRVADGPSLVDMWSKEQPVLLRDADRIAEVLARRGVADIDFTTISNKTISLSRLPVGGDGVDFDIGAVEARGRDIDGAFRTLDAVGRDGFDVALLFANDAEKASFLRALRDEVGERELMPVLARPMTFYRGGLSRGFRWRDVGLAVVNHRELFDIVVQRRTRSDDDRPVGRPIDDFVELEIGDYVVHVAHGVARFAGVEQVEKAGETQEFMSLEFRDDVKLLVPVSRADLVQKYIGSSGDAPRLSKLGGRSWTKKKRDVMKAVNDLAVEMLETQAIRARMEGVAAPPDTPWQHEFEAAFPYEETPDQLAAVEAIKTDIESPRPMDRLVCGDVGYGKTEVAMRAAFKAAISGRQVAVLVPTTVLAEQHALTFRERMANYPVRVESMSRFRSKKEQDATVLGLVEGSVDIVIGTHRILSKDVAFKDLGLLIIDEEHRFGVAHKERLRSIKRTVDVLALTATPIPRTLHMSLVGVRDISALTQAPRGRQAVKTRVVNFEEDLIRDAIRFEIGRGGQCFFVHNRVQTIDRVCKEIEAIVPEARTLVIHGQLPEKMIEKNLMAFVRHEADVLVATTIIESGLDIPSANTMFIDSPDLYGLADMHQLRGRVGRYRDKAYAYLLIRPGTILTTEAEKRVRAIEEYDELGSGFRIAMRDLEIRGAGNLLGAEQSGHIASVGYDLYCRLLDVAVKKLEKERVMLPDEVDLNVDFEAWLPSDYVPHTKSRLDLYRRLGRAASEDEVRALAAEMRDRFGPRPEVVENLLDMTRLRLMALRYRLRSIGVMEDKGVLVRPRDLKELRRRLHVSGVEHRVIAERDVLIVTDEALDRPSELFDILESALSVS